MKYIKFKIVNFKGISNLTLDLTKKPASNVIPLVGLNESGKTTILEAINFFQKEIEDDEKHKLIHKRDKGSFVGCISIYATLEFDKSDQSYIEELISNIGYTLKSSIESAVIAKKCSFENSSFDGENLGLAFIMENKENDFQVKTSRQVKYRSLYSENQQEWRKLAKLIRDKLLPKILYFPDFIFKFPDKIYLTENENHSYSGEDKKRQQEYRLAINDILISINSNYSVNKLNNKLKNGDTSSLDSAKQILTEIKNKLNKNILTKWDEIFPNTPKKTIEISHDKDNESIYLELSISEGNSSFKVGERSLGFRWFFGFILFTEFRQEREYGKETIFLIDEPANNLHPKSQQKLLTLFDKIAKKSKIIYSTHSHYLLNHESILNAFIVNDEGRKAEDGYNYKQDIKATPYKQFVLNTNVNDVTHFQPIIDVLEYVENPFEQTNNIVFFEGKNDYYTFKWIFEICLKLDSSFNFYPGAGVTKYGNIFREYLAHNRKFIAIFDADKAGISNKNKYINNISQELENNIFTLTDIDKSFNNFTTEKLFTDEEKIGIQKISFPDSEVYDKSKFNTAIQELFIKKDKFNLSKQTVNKFKKIFKFIQDNLQQPEARKSN